MRRLSSFASLLLGLSLCSLLFMACQREKAPEAAQEILMPAFDIETVPRGLYREELMIPANNPMTLAKVRLGYLLYFDPRLSADGTISCATCHHPNKGWTDQRAVSTGIGGQQGTRNAPTVINAAFMRSQFWDGRAADLEEQALGPLINPIEMGNESHDQVVARLKQIKGYQPYFQEAFGGAPTAENISQAIASFERTVLGGNSRFDRYSEGETVALSEDEVRGRELFFGKANCSQCHVGANFSDSLFHNLGVGMKSAEPDLGRFAETKLETDKGAFKTPTLRDITQTAPYMHDGSQKTLEEVIEFYDVGGEANPFLDAKMKPLNLTAQEKAELVAFLKALDSDPYPTVAEPESFPQ